MPVTGAAAAWPCWAATAVLRDKEPVQPRVPEEPCGKYCHQKGPIKLSVLGLCEPMSLGSFPWQGSPTVGRGSDRRVPSPALGAAVPRPIPQVL